MQGMTKQEMICLMNRYIGVSGGYLGDFSYRTHADFYPEYCGLEMQPARYEGTTRERFCAILNDASPADQAKIVLGVLEKYPPSADPATCRTKELHDYFRAVVNRLQAADLIDSPELEITSGVVERAISDAESLIVSGGATSAVDRLHTVLHGYLREVCARSGIAYNRDDTMTVLFKSILAQHAAFSEPRPRSHDTDNVLRALSSIMDSLGPIRNSARVAHPNSELLGRPEAELVVNVTRTILHYLDRKLLESPTR